MTQTNAQPPRFRFTRWVVVAAAVFVPLIMLILTLVVISGFGETAVLRHEIIRSYESRADLRTILLLHQDLEISQRGFLITGDERFLTPYANALGRIDPAFESLQQHLPTGDRYRDDLAEMLRISREKRGSVARSIALGRKGDRVGEQRLVMQGKVLMDRLRLLINRVEQSERIGLEQVTTVFERTRIKVRDRTYGLLAMLVILLTLAAMLTARSHFARERFRRQSDDLAARQRAIFASGMDGLIVLNGSGSIESLNPAASRMFGYEPGALLRRDIGLLLDVAPDRGEVESFLSRLDANRDGLPGEVQEVVGRRRDQTVFPVEVAISVVPLARASLFLAVCRDLSERREVEQIKSDFVATVSHELRTPLTSIAGSLGLITGGAAGPIPAKALRLIQIAQSNSARLVRLINDILDIEKIEAGRMVFDIKPVPLDHILRRAVRDNAGFASEYGVQVALDPPPECSEVLADEDRLNQVITNLLSNAVKFSPRGGTVRVKVTELNHRFRISVSDDGEGIPEAFRERIFTKFAQADNSDTRQKGGTGLGLSIVREIVARLGGNVRFESEVGRGTTFHVDLPAARREAAPVTQEEPSRDRTGQPAILHLDDDPDMLRVVSGAFDGRAEIYSTPSVVEARAAMRNHRFDAAILDIGLADGSGLELVPLLRAQDRSIPIAVFTAQQVDGSAIDGVDLVIVKSRTGLDQLLDELLAQVTARQEGRQ
ncbi:MAG: ATP-binding protein [Sphingomonas sp.]